MLNPSVRAMARRSVLCWLATAEELGRPNVSPKEIFAVPTRLQLQDPDR